ncbi:MAG: hypothetical protein ABI702_23305 [Burkholderiales bacterium]
MKICHLPLLAALLSAVLPFATLAQAPAPPGAASAAATASMPSSGPRLLTPAEKRDNADVAAAPDLRPDRSVVPQISIPLGRKPAEPRPKPLARKPAAAPGQIGDAAARCEALSGDLERAACRKKLARSRAPE